MMRMSDEFIGDLDKDTVDFSPTFDEKDLEPVVLPAQVPNLLVNGSAGIAVGMATNIPPHNLSEVVDACLALVDDPTLSVQELMEHIPGPDFPTGAHIMGRSGIRQAYETGRGRVVLRAVAHSEEIRPGKEALIVTEIPYQVGKSKLLEDIADMVREKRIEGISDIRDESDRKGMRVVFELKRGESADIVLNQLYKHSRLQLTFGIILLALVENRPVYLTLPQMIHYFLDHRREVITRRTRFLLDKAHKRAHIVEGLLKALDIIDHPFLPRRRRGARAIDERVRVFRSPGQTYSGHAPPTPDRYRKGTTGRGTRAIAGRHRGLQGHPRKPHPCR
jgi:DNA gyrase subunit A